MADKQNQKNDDLTFLAEAADWDLLLKNWRYFTETPATKLASLCAISVGLNPYFADRDWVSMVAIPHFEGTKSAALSIFCHEGKTETEQTEINARNAEHVNALCEFTWRVSIALNNLPPLGKLPIAHGENRAESTLIRFSDFAKWADIMEWDLPARFPRVHATDSYIALPSEKWPWGSHETKLLRFLAAAANRFWKNYDPGDRTTAPTNEQVTAWLVEQGDVGKRTAEVVATILRADGLPPGPRTVRTEPPKAHKQRK